MFKALLINLTPFISTCKALLAAYVSMLKIITIFFFLFLAVNVFGQMPHYFAFNTEHGLPSSEIYDVHVDKNNMLWLLTDRGVCTYNGYEFNTYTSRDGLACNTNFKMYEDKHGRFWFLDMNGTLSISENGHFRPFEFNDSLKNLESGLWMKWLTFDEDGNIIFAFHGYRKPYYDNLYKIELATGKIELFNYVSYTSFNINDNFYHLYQVDQKWFLKKNDNLNIDDDVIMNSDSVLFFYDDKTLYKIKLNPFQFTYFTLNQKLDYLYLDTVENLWVCGGGGLYFFKNSDITLPPIRYFKNSNTTNIDTDKEGNYWISTLDNGIFMVPSFSVKTLHIDNEQTTNEKILSFGKLNNHLLIGTSHHNLLAIDNDHKIHFFYQKNINKYIQHIGTFNNTATFSYGHQVKEINGELKLLNTPIFTDKRSCTILKELDERNVICCKAAGFIISGQDLNINSVEPPLLFTDKILSVHVDSSRNFWLGTLEGLYKFSLDDKTTIENVSDKYSALATRINDIQVDPKENIWVATIGIGVVYITENGIHQIGTEDGLSSDLVNKIYIDGDSSIWIGTNNGLGYFEYSYGPDGFHKSDISNYNSHDGLLSNYVNDIIAWNGHIWVGTNKGINYFRPDALDKKFPEPVVILEEINVDGVNHFNESLENKFKYFENDINFKFTSMTYRKPQNQKFYRYKILSESTETSWFYSNDRNIRFSNLLPDVYEFKVQARNKDGKWGRPAIYSFEIMPHFTQTLWFKIILMTLFTGIITGIFFWVNHSLREKERRNRIIKEAQLKSREAELATLRSQMNPHFIFNALNSIQNFIFKNDATKANYFLTRFSKLIRDGLNYSRLEYVKLEDEIKFLQSYLEIESMRFPKQFDHEINILGISMNENYYVPPLMIQPLLENSIKHGFNDIGYQGSILVTFEKKSEHALEVSVKDNGVGFLSTSNANGNRRHSLGLNILKKRIELLNMENLSFQASFSIKNLNHVDKGTLAVLVIPVIKTPKSDGSRKTKSSNN